MVKQLDKQDCLAIIEPYQDGNEDADMTPIDINTASFDRDSYLRGFVCVSSGRKLVYAKKINDKFAHIVIDDGFGMYEFACFSRNSAQRTAENTADTI